MERGGHSFDAIRSIMLSFHFLGEGRGRGDSLSARTTMHRDNNSNTIATRNIRENYVMLCYVILTNIRENYEKYCIFLLLKYCQIQYI